MTNRFTRELTYGKKLLLAAVAMLAVAAPVVIGVINPPRSRAQSQTAPLPSFEVASVKPAADSNATWRIAGGPGSADPGQFTCTNVPLQALLGMSYKLKPYQLIGPPSIKSDRFDIVAKVPAGATRDQLLLMVQDLLAKRFGLTVHRETRLSPVYELVVAKGGSKLKAPEKPPAGSAPDPTKPLPAAKDIARDEDGFPILPPGIPRIIVFPENGNVRYVARMSPLGGTFLRALEQEEGRPVVDKTGLAGVYDFNLFFRPEPAPVPGAGQVAVSQLPGEAATEGGASDLAPDLFAALERQLGLRLESAKGPIEVVVVDAFNRTPTGN